MSHVDFATVEMDGDDEAILVAADIKYDAIADLISRRKDCTQVLKTTELTLADNFEPPCQRRFTVGMALPELAEHFARNNMHDLLYLILRYNTGKR